MSSRQKTLKAQVEQASFEYGARIAWLEQEQPARLFGVRHVGRSGEILVLAQTLLIEQGLASFSMRSVASGIGMTLAALQYHFPTKDDLVRAMINHKVQYYLDGFDAMLGTLTDDPETILLSCTEWLLAASIKAGLASFEVPFWAMAAHDDYAMDAVQAYMHVYHAAFARIILRLNPTLTQVEARARAILLVAMIEGTIPTCGWIHPDQDLQGTVIATARRAALVVAVG
jgi:AcrR family transcriptional regulator